MSESEEKMTHIKDRLRRNLWEQEENEKQQEENAKLGVLFLPELFYPEDVMFLLSKIYELEAGNERLQKENEMAKALLGDVLYGGYGAHYGWEDAHDWLIANCAEYAAKFRDPTDKEIGADV